MPPWPYRLGMDALLHTTLDAIPPDADRRRVAVLLINAGLFLLGDRPANATASDPATRTPGTVADDR